MFLWVGSFLFWDKFSSSPKWIQTHCVAKDGLQLLILLPRFPSAGVTGMCLGLQSQICAGEQTQQFKLLDGHPTSWATSQISPPPFATSLTQLNLTLNVCFLPSKCWASRSPLPPSAPYPSMGIELRNSQIAVKYAIVKLHPQLIPFQILGKQIEFICENATLILRSSNNCLLLLCELSRFWCNLAQQY